MDLQHSIHLVIHSYLNGSPQTRGNLSISNMLPNALETRLFKHNRGLILTHRQTENALLIIYLGSSVEQQSSDENRTFRKVPYRSKAQVDDCISEAGMERT